MSILFHSNIYNVKTLFSLDFGTNEANLKGKHVFNIPFYQREYVWGEKNAKKLVNDISSAQHRDSQQYFLGGIVLCAKSITNDNKYIDVVDGQQRIMTITILLSVLYNFLQKNKTLFVGQADTHEKKKAVLDVYENNYSKIKQLIVQNESSLSQGTLSFYKVNAAESINTPFQDFIQYAVEKNDQAEFNDIYQYEVKASYNNQKTCNNLTKVAIELYGFIEDHYKDIKDIDSFINYINDKLLLVVTITDDLDTAFQIFETLNDRGISLSADDLIKSYIIKNSKGNYEALSIKWEKFLSKLKDSKGNYVVKPIDFFDWIFMSSGKQVPEGEIFSYFREYCEQEDLFKNHKDIEEYLDLLISYADFFKISESVHPGLRKISFMNGHSTLLSLYKIKSKPDQVKKFIKQIERFAIAYFISNKTKLIKKDLAKINKILHEYLPNLEIKSNLNPDNYESFIKKQGKEIDKAYKLFVREVNKLIASNAGEFEVSLVNTYFPKSGKRYKQAAYMLSIMAKKIGGGNYDITDQNTTIEHIMPWVDTHNHYHELDENDFIKYRGRIGNLTIINKDFNGALGSISFNEKRKLISAAKPDYLTFSLFDASFGDESTYTPYKKVFNYVSPKSWNVESIQARTEAIARLAKYLWIDGEI